MHESEKWKWSHSVVSNSSRPHGLQPTRLLRPWDFPGKSTGVGCRCLLRLTIGPFKKLTTRDFPGGPVVKNSGFTLGSKGLLHDQGIKILHSKQCCQRANKQTNPVNYPWAFRKKNSVQNFHLYTIHERCTLLSDSVYLFLPCRKGSTEPREDTLCSLPTPPPTPAPAAS